MKICPNCGSENLDSARFCSICGYKLENPKILCPYCHREIEPGQKFCNYCGADLSKKTIKNKNLKVLLYVLIGFVIVIAIVFTSYYFLNKYFAKSPDTTAEEYAKEESQQPKSDEGGSSAEELKIDASYVYDHANIIDLEYEDKIGGLISSLREESLIETYVVTANSIGDKTVEDYVSDTLEELGLENDSDEVLLFLIVLEENICRIEAGKNLSNLVSESTLGEILEQYAIPELNVGEFGSGTYNALSEIARRIYEIEGNASDDEEKAKMEKALTYPEDINFPNYTGYINDYVGLLDYDSKSKLEALTSKVERETGSEIAVAIVDSLQGATIEEYALGLFNKWGIGKEKEDNGILIIICTEGDVGNKPLRIEVGYGLELVITDFEAGLILDETIVPNFNEGNFYEGLYNAIIIIANEIYEEEGLEPIGSAEDGLMKIIVLNGEGTARIATSVTNTLESHFNSEEENVVLLEPKSADNFNYTQTEITIFTSQEGVNETAQKIQEMLGVGVLGYSDNNVDNVDISIIIGSDYTK